MVNLLKMILAYAVTYIIFYFLYKKLGAQKIISWKTSKKLILFFAVSIFCLVAVSFTDSFETTQIYHSLFLGLFLGVSTALIPFIMPVNNIKNK